MTLDVRSAAQRLGVKVDRSIRAWAAQEHPVVRETISLQPPTEQAVLADQQAVRHWIREWREVRGVVWEVRRWPSVGTQTVPVRLVLEDLDAVLAFTGATARWRLLRSRFDRLREVIGVVDARGEAAPVESALRRVGASVEGLADVDVNRLLGVLIWLRDNPTTGLRIRALPIRGVDSKWVERHRGLLKQLHGLGTEGDSFNFLPNPPLVTARFLDTTLRPGGVGHAALPIAELRALPIEPRTVLVCENLETVLTLPQLDGVVALFGAGYKASGWLKELPWVSGTRVLYWGDLDSHGFAILDGVRSGLPHVESILMDSGTLLAHRDLWVAEPDPSRAFPSRLTAAESSTFDLLREYGNPRLEQERIPWATALAEIQRVL